MTGHPGNATVLDTTVLSNFAQVNHVELLLTISRPVTVDAVREELEAGTETHPYLECALGVLGEEVAVITPSPSAAGVLAELLETLDPGEAQALTVAEVADGTVVTDDSDARATAERRGVGVTGSIGLLVRFVEAGDVSADAADEYLKR